MVLGHRYCWLLLDVVRAINLPPTLLVAILLAVGLHLLGLIFALRGKIPQHSQWMTRSYAVAIVFLETRVVAGLGGWQVNPANSAIIETIIWSGLSLSILLADLAISWGDLWQPCSGRAKAVAAVSSR
jgi:uncharacterized membrane protein YozB (DUF420 family)